MNDADMSSLKLWTRDKGFENIKDSELTWDAKSPSRMFSCANILSDLFKDLVQAADIWKSGTLFHELMIKLIVRGIIDIFFLPLTWTRWTLR